ncbi:MAG TPA: signal peptidase II [Bacteroidota bacterium]|nr:signal peptidase II [Bacteroidota bacterium]
MLLHQKRMLIAIALLVATCAGCDYATKHAAESLRAVPPVRLVGGCVTLTYAENRGAMLSLGAGLPEGVRFLVFTVAVGALLVAMAGVLLFGRNVTPRLALALALMLAGGACNLVDRLTHGGRVVDFVALSADGLHTGIFNMADVYILLGACALLSTALTPGRKGRAA